MAVWAKAWEETSFTVVGPAWGAPAIANHKPFLTGSWAKYFGTFSAPVSQEVTSSVGIMGLPVYSLIMTRHTAPFIQF